MSVRALVVAAVVSIAVLAAGSIVGNMSTTVEGTSCGSAFSPDEDAPWQADLGSTLVGGTGSGTVGDQCADRVSMMRVPAIALIVAGGIGLGATGIAAAVVAGQRPQRDDEAATAG